MSNHNDSKRPEKMTNSVAKRDRLGMSITLVLDQDNVNSQDTIEIAIKDARFGYKISGKHC